MGAVNLKTSKYFTLCNMRYRNVDRSPNEWDDVDTYYKEDLEYLKLYLDTHKLQEEENCVQVNIEYGYYEGFSLDIGINYNPDLTLATQVKEILEFEGHCKHLIREEGMEVCHPGWCTGYLNEEESFEEIHKGINKMLRDLVKQYEICTKELQE